MSFSRNVRTWSGDGADIVVGGGIPEANNQLPTELADLRARLAEVEAELRIGRYDRFLIEHTTDAVFCVSLARPLPVSLEPGAAARWIFDRGCLAAVNAAFARAYGFADVSEAIGTPLSSLVPPTDANIQMVRTVVESGHRIINARSDERDQEGRRIVLLNSIIGRIEHGFVLEYVGTSKDITAQVLAEEALRDREAHLRMVLSASSSLTFEWDIDRDTVRRVHSGEEGLPETDRATLQSVVDAIHPDDRNRFRAAIGAAMKHPDGHYASEHRIVRPSGEVRWLTETGRVEFDPHRRPVRLLGIAHDVTHLRHAAEDLRASEERLRLATRAAGIGVHDYEVHTDRNVWSPEVAAILGLPATKVATIADVTARLHPDDRARITAAMEASLDPAGPGAFAVEFRIVRADTGDVRWVSSHSQTFFVGEGDARRPVRNTGVLIDISDRKGRELAEREAARHKDEFIAVLAHELRNPLAPVRTAVAILRARQPSDPHIVKCRDIIDRQVAHMARLLDDLLDVSRLSRGTLTLQRRRMHLSDAIDAAIEMARPLIDERGHALVVEGVDPAIVLDADVARLTQVFANLLNNAAKYTKPGGAIRVIVREHPATVTVSISDTGIGIDPMLQEHVFELFTLGDGAARSDRGLGVGLGLAKRLVEMHGGTIGVLSAGRDQGATFIVTLAHADAPDPPDSTTPAPNADTQFRRRVLVADDNADAAETLAMLLETLGCEVRTVYDGESAVRESAVFRPDLVLLDLGMPGMTGQTACHRIRGENRGAPMVIAAVTGWGLDDDRRRTRAAGFDHHLVKPVESDVLIRLVHSLPHAAR